MSFCHRHLFLLLLLVTSGNGLVYAGNVVYHVDIQTKIIDGNHAPFDQVNPGDTLILEQGQREFLVVKNLTGSEECRIIIINGPGQVIINTNHYFGISIRNCRYLRLTGTGDNNHYYGIAIQRVEHGGGIGVGEGSSDTEIDHISIEHCSGVGISAKTDPDCSFGNTREKFTQYNTNIHDNYISHVAYEGLYIGSTKYFGQMVSCNGSDTLLMPSLLNGVRIYNNIVQYTGWDGIQVSSASSDCMIYDNVVMFDSQDEFPGQMSGIIIGGGSKCDCYNNKVSSGKGNGIENHGLGGYRIFNNLLIEAGKSFLPDDYSQMRHGIYISDVTALDDASFYILHNTIVSPKSDGIRFASKKSRNNIIVSNLIMDPGNYDYYENGNTSFGGEDSFVMIPDSESDVFLSHNYLTRNISDALISSETFEILAGSPLIDAAYSQSFNVTFDMKYQIRPAGAFNDIGAYEFPGNSPGIVDSLSEKSQVLVYPNPANELLILEFNEDLKLNGCIEIYNSRGQLTKNVNHTNGSLQKVRIDVSTFHQGMYYFVCFCSGGKLTGKFTVNH